jgi:nitrous oxide reductase accessory protein NosL
MPKQNDTGERVSWSSESLFDRVVQRCALILLLILLLAPGLEAAGNSAPKPGARDKCPVCGMLVAGFANWASTIVFKDGSHIFFDGPKDMFKYLLDLKRYNSSKQPGDIEAIFVTDYYKVVSIDGRKAWYVVGSDVLGPMGDEIVPMEKESDARAFMKDHKGKKILTFQEVTPDIIKGLDSSRDRR